MKLLYNEIASKTIQKLIINSLEQALYQAIVQIDGEEYIVWETDEKPLLKHSMGKLRELFQHLEIEEVVLRQESPYDEMIGQAAISSSNRLEIPLAKNTTKVPKWTH